MCGDYERLLDEIPEDPERRFPREDSAPKAVFVLNMHDIGSVQPLGLLAVVLFGLLPDFNGLKRDVCQIPQAGHQVPSVGRYSACAAGGGQHGYFHGRGCRMSLARRSRPLMAAPTY